MKLTAAQEQYQHRDAHVPEASLPIANKFYLVAINIFESSVCNFRNLRLLIDF